MEYLLEQLLPLMGMYAGWRALEVDGLTTRAFEAVGTILAGCSNATTVARVLLVRLLRKTHRAFPSLNIWNVVDDVSCQVAGHAKGVAMIVGGAGNMLAVGASTSSTCRFQKANRSTSSRRRHWTPYCKSSGKTVTSSKQYMPGARVSTSAMAISARHGWQKGASLQA